MKNLLRIASVAVVSAIVLLTTVAVLTPRVVRAVTAELVQNVDSPPRNPWSQSCIANSDAAGASCTISVPSNQEITIQTVTFNGTTSPDHDHLVLLLETTAGGNDAQWNNQFTRTVIPATGGGMPRCFSLAKHSRSTPIRDRPSMSISRQPGQTKMEWVA
jgi:hypothetical protein